MHVQGNHVFGRLKLGLAVDSRVVFGRTADEALDGMGGTIVGKVGDDPVADFYIVMLDEPYNGQKAIQIIESCLSPL